MRIRFSAAEWLTIAALAGSVVVAFVRLEGRVNTQDASIVSVKEDAKSDKDDAKQFSDRIYQELLYIRTRVDELAKERDRR